MKLDELIKETFSLTAETKIQDNQGPGDLEGWDSLGHVNLINEIESKYSVSLGLDEMMEIEKVSDIRKLLESKGVSGF